MTSRWCRWTTSARSSRAPSTRSRPTSSGGTLVNVTSWYDNEMGYSARCVDLLRYVGSTPVKRTLESLDKGSLEGRRALVRVDFNVPSRTAWSPTTPASGPPCRRSSICGTGGPAWSCCPTWAGPRTARTRNTRCSRWCAALEKLLGAPVTFLPDPTSPEAVTVTKRLPRGGVAVAENTRFYPGEEKNDPSLAERFAALGDLYVNDAFGSAHRAHASTEAVARLLKPAVSGFLMERELRYLGEALHQPKRPFVAVLGGAKISGKIDLIEALLPKVDDILLGGAMACTFFKAMGLETGKSLVEPDRVDLARDLMKKAGNKLVLPEGAVIARELAPGTETRTVKRRRDPAGLGGLRHRSGHGEELRARSSRGPERWCGTARWACSRRRRSITAPWPSPRPWPTPPRTGRHHGDRRRRLRGGGGPGRTGRQDHPRLHRRWRVARVSGGERTAGRRRPGRGCDAWLRASADLFAANWKMNHGPAEARAFAQKFLPLTSPVEDAAPLVLPASGVLGASRRGHAVPARCRPSGLRTSTGSPRAPSPAGSRFPWRWKLAPGSRWSDTPSAATCSARPTTRWPRRPEPRSLPASRRWSAWVRHWPNETAARTEQVIVRQLGAVLAGARAGRLGPSGACLRAGLGHRHRQERHA